MFQSHPNGRLMQANDALARILGYDTADALMTGVEHMNQIYARPEDRARLIEQLLNEGGVDDVIFSARRRDGSEVIVELSARTILDGDGNPDYIEGSAQDVTARLDAERALQQSEMRYRTLVESAPELIVLLDQASGHYVDANENALRFFGVSRGRLPELKPLDLSAAVQAQGADAAQLFASRCARAAAGEPQVFEWLHRDARGIEVETEMRLMALPGAGGLLRASITDIRARRRAEKLTAGERDVFERIAADAALSEVLDSIVALIESINSSFTAAISRVGPDGQSFIEVVGKRMPARWRAVEERLPVDIRNGSRAAAVTIRASARRSACLRCAAVRSKTRTRPSQRRARCSASDSHRPRGFTTRRSRRASRAISIARSSSSPKG